MKKLTIIIVLMFITILLYGCIRDDSYKGYEEPIEETQYKMLIKSLVDKGFTVEGKDRKDLEHHILLGKPKWLNINNYDHIYVYLYENSENMELDISNLSEDGYSYFNNKRGITIDWVYPPQYFKKGNMVALYVGEDVEIINALEELLGSQFIRSSEKIL